MEENIKIRIETEKKRLIELMDSAQIPKQNRAIMCPVVDNLAWMRIKLEDTMEEIKDASVVVPYDNGGGQSGLRENPIFKGYNTLWRSYMSGLEKYASIFPKDIQDSIVNDGQTVLDRVKRMKGANK